LSALAYVLLKLDCEPAPLILGFILGPLMAENLRRSLMIAFGDVTVFVTADLGGLLIASVALLVVIALPTLRASAGDAGSHHQSVSSREEDVEQ
jgi:TctA family transporter